MGVNLRGGEVFVAQEFLDRAEILVCLENVSGEEMTESVRRDPPDEPVFALAVLIGVPGVRECLARSS